MASGFVPVRNVWIKYRAKMEIANKFPHRLARFLIAITGLCVIALTAVVAESAEIGVRYKQNGETVSIARGDTLVVRLPLRPGSPFHWGIFANQVDKLKPTGAPALITPESGGPWFQVFRFEAIGSGSVPLTMQFTGPGHIRKQNTKVFRVTVVIE
jgi:hypothetical protein